MPTADLLQLVAYEPEWIARFQQLGRQLRLALGDIAVRIDHVGATAIPGMDALPVMDVQVSIYDLEDARYSGPLEAFGFVREADRDQLVRLFRSTRSPLPVLLSFCQAGGWVEQGTLLFRDYLRAHPREAAAYTALRQDLTARPVLDRTTYRLAKRPFVWQTLEHADAWARETAWQLSPSDA